MYFLNTRGMSSRSVALNKQTDDKNVFFFYLGAILEQSLDELYIMWLRRPPHVQINVSKTI